MSIFKSYTPRTLYHATLKMVGTLFVRPPKLKSNPTSYFTAVIEAHQWIKKDLTGVLKEEQTAQENTTIKQIHSSLRSIEMMLFGEESEFDTTIKGCCIYTEYIEMRLNTATGSCVVV